MRWLFATHVPEQNLNFPSIPTDEDIERSVVTGLPVRLSEKWMLVRRALDKLWNVYSFFVTYANIDAFDPTRHHSILRRHKKTLQSETLADHLSVVVDQPAASLPDEVYREKISPQERKKLENYTVEVVLGRL